MDVDGQAAVGDQLTTDEGDLLSSDRVRWRMGALQPNAPLTARRRGLVTDTHKRRWFLGEVLRYARKK